MASLTVPRAGEHARDDPGHYAGPAPAGSLNGNLGLAIPVACAQPVLAAYQAGHALLCMYKQPSSRFQRHEQEVNHVYSYLTSPLAGQRHCERQAEQRQAQAAALATSSRHGQRARTRRGRWAVRKVGWLRSEPLR
jgi:hypothetical protein